MSLYTYDLHVHSCLSPCGDEDNTPNNLAGMATLNNIQIMALTDHNTTKNCPAFFAACKRYGIIPIPGMELTTSEEIHVVCLFPTLEDAMAFNEAVDSRREKFPNRTDIFGDQLIMDARASLDQSYRKTVYKACLDIIVDWAVEVPVYQRQNAIIFSTERVNMDTVTPDITTYYGWMAEIQNIELAQ